MKYVELENHHSYERKETPKISELKQDSKPTTWAAHNVTGFQSVHVSDS